MRHKACASAGVKELRFHDLRHAGNNLTASTGASTKELMACFGQGMKRGSGRNGHAAGTPGE